MLVNTELKSRCSDSDPFPGGAGFSHALLIGGIGLTFPDQLDEIQYNCSSYTPSHNYTQLPALSSAAAPTETGVVSFNNPRI